MVPKSVTLNGIMAVTLRNFTEFGKPALQKTICGGICARVYRIFIACTMLLQRKFTFAISSHLLMSFLSKLFHCQNPSWNKGDLLLRKGCSKGKNRGRQGREGNGGKGKVIGKSDGGELKGKGSGGTPMCICKFSLE